MTTTTRDGRPVTAAEIYIDQLADGTCFTSKQQGEFGSYVLWEDHQAEVKRLTNERDKAARAERARCIAVIRRVYELLPAHGRRSRPGLRDAIIALETIDELIGANETQHTA